MIAEIGILGHVPWPGDDDDNVACAERIVAEWEPNPPECEVEAAQFDN